MKKKSIENFNINKVICVMCTKIRDNKRQNDNFIHIAIKKRIVIHPATMFRIACASSGLKQMISTIPPSTSSSISSVTMRFTSIINCLQSSLPQKQQIICINH